MYIILLVSNLRLHQPNKDYLSVRPSVRPSVCPSVRPSVRPSLCCKFCPRVVNPSTGLGCRGTSFKLGLSVRPTLCTDFYVVFLQSTTLIKA
jgi:hypothetical protein